MNKKTLFMFLTVAVAEGLATAIILSWQARFLGENIPNFSTIKLTAKSYNLDKEFQLKVNQKAQIKPENIEIKFLNVVSDSRCPSRVVCVWSGEATVRINISKNNQSLGDFNIQILIPRA